jgi:chromosome segregation protein
VKLRTLRLHGFKSFADRTQLEFRDGITAIVGSNGCGKSNIADAIRWVLGEQRASAIRGAKMDEVIFQGTTKRRPLNFAEVALLFGNEDGRVAIPQTEIEISRKTFREGGSEYALNRTACRLRDIHTLLRDTGLGSNAYSIIETGMIETLLSDRAEERRSLFEEAAGIGRYKDSRQTTTRRLEAAETDLARLGDLVAEVETKVRALARQRRKAQRLTEMQARRLDLEVSLARTELVRLEGVLAEGAERLLALEGERREAGAARAAAEASLTRARAALADLARRRAAAVTRLDEVRTRLNAREREAMLADERRGNAEMRIAQLVRERAEQEGRRASLEAEWSRLGAQRVAQAEVLEAARERLEASTEGSTVVRSRLAGERERSETAVVRSRETARETATVEGECAALDATVRDGAARLERLAEQQRELEAEIAHLGAQTDLWADAATRLEARVEAAAEEAERAREEIAVLRGREAAATASLRAAEDAVSHLSAQIAAREALERSYEGFAPAVAAVMAAADRFPGVRGPLADFIDTTGAPAGVAAAVETYLGPHLHALVVDDMAAARRVRQWFREEWKGGGSLLLLPLDAAALRAGATPATPDGVRGAGAGLPWMAALLEGMRVAGEADPLDDAAPAGPRVGGAGEVVDGRGVVRLVSSTSGEGILARRERLAALRSELEAARALRTRAGAERDAAREVIEEAEERAREAEELRRTSAAELQRTRGEAAAHGHRRQRVERERDEVARSAEQGRARLEEGTRRRAELGARLDALRAAAAEAERLAVEVSGTLSDLQEQWETVRDEEAEFRVAVARAEGDLRETERRLGGARGGADAAAARLRAIDAEAAELRGVLESLSGVRDRAGEDLAGLLDARDRETAAIADLDTRVAEHQAEATAAEATGRRSAEREAAAAEERHRLELAVAEARSRTERVRERLEAEWGRPWASLAEAATPVEEGEPEGWQREVVDLASQIEALGPVNMLAVEEHEEEARRLEFLLAQQKDLIAARDDLVAAIRQINRTAREVFESTFATIRENFQRTFHSLFQGGECDVWLTDADDPLESPVEIHASPRGKRTQRIHLLSGGERTLTALALLFAIYLVKPSPFCLLDEVDAPLDESNVGRFLQLLQDFKADTQFVVITHNTRTMEAADWVYGVTMEEPGVSSIVGVELEGAWMQEGRVA